MAMSDQGQEKIIKWIVNVNVKILAVHKPGSELNSWNAFQF